MLDDTIRCGNSLVDDTFYLKQDLLDYTEEERERVNTFNWQQAYPDVMAAGGFDVVIGNPPYVKLQNFRRVHPDVAEYLRDGRLGRTYYQSTQTGNFDIYLPFIERAISLLSENGRMGFIAPSLWTKNEYGRGLRELVHQGRYLERWIDFEAYQVFDEAITYTALQFFTRRPNESVRIFQAPDGDADVAKRAWDDPENVVPYSSLVPREPWVLLPRGERELIERVSGASRRLDDPSVSRGIIVGVQTSADHIYHLERLGRDRYLCRPKDDRGRRDTEYEVVIEDEIMLPLVSGPQAKRYEEPKTNVYILFPYDITNRPAQLLPPERMEHEFPRAWSHLRSYERELRAREKDAFDDEQWYRFGRSQNIDKQHLPKLMVPRLVTDLACSFDYSGDYCLDNVDVCGVLTASGVDGYFILGVLNSRLVGWIFRRISKPFQGNFRSANRQFIAPLPIPLGNSAEIALIADLAKSVQDFTTRRRLKINEMRARRQACGTRLRSESWLWPHIQALDEWEPKAPAHLDSHERADWAKRQRSKDLEARLDAIQARLKPGAVLEAERRGAELVFAIDGVPVLERIFVEESEADFILAQWRLVARTFTVAAQTRAKGLTDALRRLAVPREATPVRQVLALETQLEALDAQIKEIEAEIEGIVAELYGLTDEDLHIIARG